MNDEAIQKIISYANEYLFEPRSNWSKQAIMERSYERWAVDEILLTIMDHPLTEADFVIEGFILKMEFFLHMSGNQANNLIFQVAENTAEALLGLIYNHKFYIFERKNIMKVLRKQEIETANIQVGDQVIIPLAEIGEFSATAHKVTDEGIMFGSFCPGKICLWKRVR